VIFTVGAEHAGADYASRLAAWLENQGHEVHHIGETETLSGYPAVAEAACAEVLSGASDLTILICGTGIGMSMAANKVVGIRAALCTDAYMGKMAKMHNNANVLVFGSRVIGFEHMLDILSAFLNAEYEGGRHEPRVAALMALDDRR